jgi:hypothetical protein
MISNLILSRYMIYINVKGYTRYPGFLISFLCGHEYPLLVPVPAKYQQCLPGYAMMKGRRERRVKQASEIS